MISWRALINIPNNTFCAVALARRRAHTEKEKKVSYPRGVRTHGPRPTSNMVCLHSSGPTSIPICFLNIKVLLAIAAEETKRQRKKAQSQWDRPVSCYICIQCGRDGHIQIILTSHIWHSTYNPSQKSLATLRRKPSPASPLSMLLQWCRLFFRYFFEPAQNNIGQGVWGKRKPLSNVIVWDCSCTWTTVRIDSLPRLMDANEVCYSKFAADIFLKIIENSSKQHYHFISATTL